MAPLFGPALHPGVVHVGRVTSRDPRTPERRSTARRAAQRHHPRANRCRPGRSPRWVWPDPGDTAAGEPGEPALRRRRRAATVRSANRWLELCDVVVDEGDPALDHDHRERHRPPRHGHHAGPVAARAGPPVGRRGPGGRVRRLLGAPVRARVRRMACRHLRHARRGHGPGPRVRVQRDGDVLSITLTRPERLNALDAPMRDELVEALTLAAATHRHQRGSSCGARARPSAPAATSTSSAAGRIRRRRTSSAWNAASGGRCPGSSKPTVTYLHGACMGSGIELAAFTDWVVAAADTQIASARDRARPRCPARVGRSA